MQGDGSPQVTGQPAGFNFINAKRCSYRLSLSPPFFHYLSLSLSLCRNGKLLAEGYRPPQAVRTGTSIVGIIYADGVILGADTRATEGPIVSDKNCSKIHRLQDHIL